MNHSEHQTSQSSAAPSSYEQVVTGDPFYEKDLKQMSIAVNYLQWQFNLIRPFLGGHVLEVGGGIGNFTGKIAASAATVISLEPNHKCFMVLREAIRDLPNVQLLESMVEEVPKRLGSNARFDAIVCLNVLEHIQDDRAATALLAGLLAPRGHLLLMVPAVPWAFGEIDRRLGHFRRYSKQSMRLVLRSAGLHPVQLRYVNMIGLAGWLWNAHVGKRNAQDDKQIAFFDRFLVPIISRVESAVAPPLGQSLIVAATPPAS